MIRSTGDAGVDGWRGSKLGSSCNKFWPKPSLSRSLKMSHLGGGRPGTGRRFPSPLEGSSFRRGPSRRSVLDRFFIQVPVPAASRRPSGAPSAASRPRPWRPPACSTSSRSQALTRQWLEITGRPSPSPSFTKSGQVLVSPLRSATRPAPTVYPAVTTTSQTPLRSFTPASIARAYTSYRWPLPLHARNTNMHKSAAASTKLRTLPGTQQLTGGTRIVALENL